MNLGRVMDGHLPLNLTSDTSREAERVLKPSLKKGYKSMRKLTMIKKVNYNSKLL
jgi:hypothetical protein